MISKEPGVLTVVGVAGGVSAINIVAVAAINLRVNIKFSLEILFRLGRFYSRSVNSILGGFRVGNSAPLVRFMASFLPY